MAVSLATKECSAKQVLCTTQILKKMSKLISKRNLMFFLAMTIGKTPQVFFNTKPAVNVHFQDLGFI